MKIISKKEKIDSVPIRWLDRYKNWTDGDDKLEKYNKLIKLNPLTESKIKEIIGNDSWTENICDECEKDSDIIIRLGQNPDYESRTAYICLNCLKKAINISK